MHEPSFLAGLELGKFTERLKRLETGFLTLRRDLDTLTGQIRRWAILVSLWGIAILANVSTDRAAELAVELVSSVLKR